jgi:negative regulator of sigma E activity
MSVSKETLMAYVDGELDTSARAEVEAAIAQDSALAQEVEKHRALRRQLQSAFEGVLAEPVPDRLIAAARTAPISAPKTTVADFARARAEKTTKTTRRWSLPQWSAMAACLIVGLLLGHQLLRPSTSGPVGTEDGRLVARGSLANALSTQLASESSPNDAVHVALSFRDGDGNYCRTFVMKDGSTLAGLACHENNTWRVEALSQDSKEVVSKGGYRMAGGDLAPSVLQAVQERIEGDPLDAIGEKAAREKHWR